MNCHHAKKLLILYLDDELSNDISDKIEIHLNACVNCQKEKEALSQTWLMLSRYETPKLPDDFTSSLMSKIHAENAKIYRVTYPTPQISFWFDPRRLVPVMALCIAVFLTIIIIRQTPIREKPQAALPRMTDEEIIQNLDILENMEILENLNLLKDLDVAEHLESEQLS